MNSSGSKAQNIVFILIFYLFIFPFHKKWLQAKWLNNKGLLVCGTLHDTVMTSKHYKAW